MNSVLEKAPLLGSRPRLSLSEAKSPKEKKSSIAPPPPPQIIANSVTTTAGVVESDDHDKAAQQGIKDRHLEACVRRIQREFAKKSLRKKYANLKLKSTDEGAGDLVPWSFQTARFIFCPNSKFNDPSMMNAINGEV